MPQATKKTAKRLARIAEMVANGDSTRSIAKKEGISHQTVCNWVEQIGLTKKKPADTTPAEKKAADRRAKVEAIVIGAAGDVSRDGDSPALASLRRRHAQIQASIDVVFKDVASGDMTPSALGALTKWEIDYAVKIAELEALARPPERPDPKNDPMSLAGAERFTAKLEHLVAVEEEKLVCCHCGEHPFR